MRVKYWPTWLGGRERGSIEPGESRLPAGPDEGEVPWANLQALVVEQSHGLEVEQGINRLARCLVVQVDHLLAYLGSHLRAAVGAGFPAGEISFFRI